MSAAGIVLSLVVLATGVAVFAHRLRVPAPSLLVLAGLAVALIPGTPTIKASPEAIGLVVLPPLLYASAKEISARELRALWRPLVGLTLGLVLATAAGVAGVAYAVTSLSVPMAFVLGAVLASTDPVAVTALGRTLPLPPRIQALAQAESLFNDATSLVLFQVAVGVVAGSGVDVPEAGWRFIMLAGGGAGVGAALAGVVIAVRSRAADPVLHAVIALVTPYAAYMLAEAARVSGVSAVVVAGVVVGNAAGRATSDAGARLQVRAVYAVVVFLLESVVFAVIGLQLPALVRDLPAGTGWWPVQAGLLAVTLVAIRIAWTRPTVACAAATRDYPAWPLTRVLTWAGTRGAVPLAAALAIPLTGDGGRVLAERPLVLVLTTAVVASTLTVQGLTLAPIVRSSGLAADPDRLAAEEQATRSSLDEVAVAYIDTLEPGAGTSESAREKLRLRYAARLDVARDGGRPEAFHQLHRNVIAAQRAELRRLRLEGRISDGLERRLEHELDRQESTLGG